MQEKWLPHTRFVISNVVERNRKLVFSPQKHPLALRERRTIEGETNKFHRGLKLYLTLTTVLNFLPMHFLASSTSLQIKILINITTFIIIIVISKIFINNISIITIVILNK